MWASGYIWLLSDVEVCSLVVWVWGYGCCDSVLGCFACGFVLLFVGYVGGYFWVCDWLHIGLACCVI